MLRRPSALLPGLALHPAIPLLVVSLVAFLTDDGSGLVTAVILIVTMALVAGATASTGKGDGDRPTRVRPARHLRRLRTRT